MHSEFGVNEEVDAPHGLTIDLDRLAAMDAQAATSLFDHAGYLPLPGLLSSSALDTLQAEATKLWAKAKRRDFAMECMGEPPGT